MSRNRPVPPVHSGPRGWHSRGYLPHFDAGSEYAQSVTFRLADSVPKHVLGGWEQELRSRPDSERELELHHLIEAFLDTGWGACHLRDPRVAGLVEGALLHFDGLRYRMHAWVVMPNHVHTLFTPMADQSLSGILWSWKSFTAKEANRLLGRAGQFWQEDYFDRYIRSDVHFHDALTYIEFNPVSAGLCARPEDWPFGSARAPGREPMTRRDFLFHSGGGLGGIALAALLGEERLLADGAKTHHKPRAKRVVQLFMAGGASHIDLFDFKPELVKQHGKPANFGEHVEAFQNGLGPWLKPIWEFKPFGKTGKLLSEVVAPLGSVVDDIAFIHNMVGKTGVHSQGTLLQTTGFNRPGFPGMGCWVSYGLGSLNQNLPTFVVLPDHRGLASNGTKNWDSAFLPAQHQGTAIFPGTKTPVEDLFPDERATFITRDSDRAGIDLLGKLNREHAASRVGDERLDARIKSYELAAKMQLAAPGALDISKESRETLKLYGLDHGKSSFDKDINPLEETDYFARKCLIARRLLERGVRFVQVWSGNDNGFPRRNWDSHEDVLRDHGPLAEGMARGASALIADLKRTGLLDDTIVLWTTEFGRMPSSQGGKGRDHNPYCFTNWLAGGGIKAGTVHGPSDDFGYKPADRKHPTEVYDVHATILHLLGIDHTRLTVRHNGIDRRLTDVHGHVIEELLA